MLACQKYLVCYRVIFSILMNNSIHLSPSETKNEKQLQNYLELKLEKIIVHYFDNNVF